MGDKIFFPNLYTDKYSLHRPTIFTQVTIKGDCSSPESQVSMLDFSNIKGCCHPKIIKHNQMLYS